MHSARLYKTVASLGFKSGLFASTQGVVSSIYLFARPISLKISCSAFGTLSCSISVTSDWCKPSAKAISSLSISSFLSGAGRTPPKDWLIIADVLETRLPKSLTRSVLIRVKSDSFEYAPSLPNGISRSKKYLNASEPYLATISLGSVSSVLILSCLLFDSLSPPIKSQPWP